MVRFGDHRLRKSNSFVALDIQVEADPKLKRNCNGSLMILLLIAMITFYCLHVFLRFGYSSITFAQRTTNWSPEAVSRMIEFMQQAQAAPP